MAKSKKLTSGEGWSLVPAADPTESEAVSLPPAAQKIRISLEKRAKGKTVTLVSPLVLSSSDLKQLAKQLKNACGAGGTERPGEIELQGDCRDRVRDWLKANGWGVRG